MRVCSKCGFIDPAEWKPLKFHADVDYTHIEDFKEMHPKLAEQLLHLQNGNLLKKQAIIQDKIYTYTLHGKGRVWVHRIPNFIFDKFGYRRPTEKYRKPKLSDPRQRKLLEKDERGRVHVHPTTEKKP